MADVLDFISTDGEAMIKAILAWVWRLLVLWLEVVTVRHLQREHGRPVRGDGRSSPADLPVPWSQNRLAPLHDHPTLDQPSNEEAKRSWWNWATVKPLIKLGTFALTTGIFVYFSFTTASDSTPPDSLGGDIFLVLVPQGETITSFKLSFEILGARPDYDSSSPVLFFPQIEKK